MGGLIKAYCPPHYGWASSNVLKGQINTKAERGKIHPFYFLPAYLSWGIDLLLPWDWGLCHRLPGFRTELHHWLFWVCSLQMTGHRTSQPPQSQEPVPYNKSLPTHMPLVLFLCRTLTDASPASDPCLLKI